MTPGYFPTTRRLFKHWTPPENPTTIGANTPMRFNSLPYRRKNMSDNEPSTSPDAPPATPKQTALQKLIAYGTGALALALVAASTGSAITYAVLHGQDTLSQLGMSVLNGVGIAVGGCLGSALVLRFKAARRFVNGVVHDVHDHHFK